jgi:RNA polymerase sigma-70 factor (ECF subfamily)
MSSKNNGYTDEELYRDLFTPLFKYAYFRTRDYDLASDLAQSAFLKFMLQDKKPGDKEHGLRLLFTITRTLLIDHFRAEARHRIESLGEAELEMASEAPGPEEIFERGEDVALAKKLLALLSPAEEEIVSLRISSELPYEDIAVLVGTSNENARQIYSRALAKIKRSLEENNIQY